MKTIITFLLLSIISGAALAGKFKPLNNYEIFSDGPEFTTTVVPDVWKNESAVILAKKVINYYPFETNHKCVRSEAMRYRIKIQDKSAADFFSNFYYYMFNASGWKEKWADSIRIIVEKKDGTKKTVPTGNATPVSYEEVPYFYLSSYTGTYNYSKLPIPDLEVGDILDFSILNNQVYLSQYMIIEFPIVVEPLQEEYPILNAHFDFKISKEYYINYRQLNGGPELKYEGDCENNMKCYSVSVNNLNAQHNEKWFYRLRNSAGFKFLALFKIDEKTIHAPSLDSVNTQFNSIKSKEAIDGYFKALYPEFVAESEIPKLISKYHPGVTDNNEIVKLVYYYLRFYVFEGYTQNTPDWLGRNDGYFTETFKRICKKYKIPFSYVITTDKRNCTLEDIIHTKEFRNLPMIDGKIIFPYVSQFSNITDFDPKYAGMKGWILSSKPNVQTDTAFVTIPTSKSSDNIINENLNVTFSENMDETNVEVTTHAKGIERMYLSNRSIPFYEWEETDASKFNGHPVREKNVSHNAKLEEERTRKAQSWQEKVNQKIFDLNKERMKKEFSDLGEYKEFSLLHDGRSADSAELVFKEAYSLQSHLIKLGQNYSFDLGSLIGKQVTLTEKDKNRQNDIWLDNARTYEYTINLQIPTGYHVQGLEGIKFNVDNQTGSFISDAVLSGNTLSVHIKKIYKGDFSPASEWEKLRAFVDAASDFYQKKIILAKS